MGGVLVDDDDAVGGLGDDPVFMQLRPGGAQGVGIGRSSSFGLRLLAGGGDTGAGAFGEAGHWGRGGPAGRRLGGPR
jgi:hypothetical protein